MKRSRRAQPIRRQGLYRVIEGVLFLGLLVGLFFLHQYVSATRVRVYSLQQQLEQEPVAVLQQATIREELRDRADELEQVKKLIVGREAIGEFVGAIEQVAGTLGVTVQIPTIREEQELNAEGKVVEPTGPLRQVRIEVVGNGRAENLLRFLHAMEHLPYLASVSAWELEDSSDEASGSGGRQQVGENTPVTPAATGLLRAQVLLTVHEGASL